MNLSVPKRTIINLRNVLRAGAIGCLLTLVACNNDDTPKLIEHACEVGGEVIHYIENGVGHAGFDEELQAFVIRYHVPGTIDSTYTGVICDEVIPEPLIDKSGRVRFTGKFIDAQGQIQVTIQFGGESFYFLEVDSLEFLD